MGDMMLTLNRKPGCRERQGSSAVSAMTSRVTRNAREDAATTRTMKITAAATPRYQ